MMSFPRLGSCCRRSWFVLGLFILTAVVMVNMFALFNGDRTFIRPIYHSDNSEEILHTSKRYKNHEALISKIHPKTMKDILRNYPSDDEDMLDALQNGYKLNEADGTVNKETDSPLKMQKQRQISTDFQKEKTYNLENVNSDKAKPSVSSLYNKRSHLKPDLSYLPESLNLLSKTSFNFLQSYKNPCWLENFHPSAVYSPRRELRAIHEIYRKRRLSGDYHRIRCLPYFFLVGASKCASTDLFYRIISHPQICPQTKEPQWWSRRRYAKVLPLESYIDLFDRVAYQIESDTTLDDEGNVYHHLVTGEGSVSTFWDNDDWWAMVGNENTTEPRVLNQHYIHHFLPKLKLILILRNPVDRLYSGFIFRHQNKTSPEDFHESVIDSLRSHDECFLRASIRSCAYNFTITTNSRIRVRVGFYSVYLKDWLKVYPRQQFFVIRTEDYAVDQLNIMRKLFQFLDLRNMTSQEEHRMKSLEKQNTRKPSVGDMLPTTRKLLQKFYEPFNQELAYILQDSKYLWKDGIVS